VLRCCFSDLQRVAVGCSELQCVALVRVCNSVCVCVEKMNKERQRGREKIERERPTLCCLDTCCRVCCSVPQCVALYCSTLHSMLQCIAVCCSTLQRMLQYVAVHSTVKSSWPDLE